MNVVITILSTIVAINALLLIGLILIQQSKGGGFASSAFGGASETVFGAQAGSHLTKLTVILTTSFFLLTLGLAIITGKRGEKQSYAEQQETAQVQTDLETPETAKKGEAKAADATEKDKAAAKAATMKSTDKAGKVTAEITPEDLKGNELKTEKGTPKKAEKKTAE